MDLTQFKDLTYKSRSMREMGIALVSASAILALILVIPVTPETKPQPVVAIVPPVVPPPDAYAALPLDAQAAIVYDLSTGKTLYAKNADVQLPLASLTKLLAVYAAVEALPSGASITISKNAARHEAPHAFREGQILSLGDISRLTLTASLNDGAAAITEAVAARQNTSPSEALGAAAASLNLSQTYAVNGNGLDETATISGGYGSAYDIARLAGALVEKAPSIAMATTRATTAASSEGGTGFSVKNTDPIIGDIPHLLLSKTGLTDLAGGNLALVFDVGINHPIAVVVLGSTAKARFADGSTLVSATLAHFAGVASL
jgi:serine-type D-Ala-D-Ala carboxypeptidase (penicillin-binding protein 5/6)